MLKFPLAAAVLTTIWRRRLGQQREVREHLSREQSKFSEEALLLLLLTPSNKKMEEEREERKHIVGRRRYRRTFQSSVIAIIPAAPRTTTESSSSSMGLLVLQTETFKFFGSAASPIQFGLREDRGTVLMDFMLFGDGGLSRTWEK